jgi:hypothetical protein
LVLSHHARAGGFSNANTESEHHGNPACQCDNRGFVHGAALLAGLMNLKLVHAEQTHHKAWRGSWVSVLV